MQERVRVGAAQVAPHFFDKRKTLEKTVRFIEEGGRLGLDLLVFPETYFAAYPYWRGAVSVRRSTELVVEMQRHAIRADGEEAAVIADAARRARVHCVVGCNELDDRPGSLTLYNTLLFVGRGGTILGRHRKLMPTHSERVYWGMGDAADIRVFDLDIGVVGGLICYEHHMTLLRAAMAIKGEEIHCAVWPGWWKVDRHLGGKSPEPAAETCDIEPAIREYAIENQAFVVSSSWFLRPDDVPADLRDEMRYNLAVGGSCIVNPAGLFLAGPVFNEETIVWTEITAEERRLAKAYFDCLGHYARFDLLSLNIREEAWSPTGPRAPVPGTGEPRRDPDLRRVASRYGVKVEDLEAYLARRADRAD
ncbi:MAG: carbon-nitrogen hydrolase family protein [candidate division NC10 bacterium]|nr:carbon-nitrogen hydrolase family protein [candidate division NC10 bacterium]